MDHEFNLLIDTWVDGVYRFHLARSGDWLDAETLTAQTFLDAYLGRVKDPVALMRLALARQAGSRGSGGLRNGSSSNDPILAHGDAGASEAVFKAEETEQGRLLRRAQITALRDYWPTLAPAQADAVALACFAGLDLPAIARTLRAAPAQVAGWLDSQSVVVSRLAELAESIQVPPLFETELEVALNQVDQPGWGQRWLEGIRQGLSWLAYQARPGMGQHPWLAPAAFVLLLVGVGVWSTTRLASQSLASRPQTTFSPTAQSAETTPQPDLQAVGLLLPPDQAVCRQWQNRLTALTGGDAVIDPEAVFNDPAGTGPDFYGKGCFITINASLAPDADAPGMQKKLLDQLAKEGYQQTLQFPTGESSNLAIRYRGQGYSLARQNDRLVVEWLTAPDPDPNSKRSLIQPLTPTPPDRLLLYFGVATRAARPVVEGFTAAWAAGNESVTRFFSADLRKRLPDLAALDRTAGIVRSASTNLAITWKLIENQGANLRLGLSPTQVSQLALPSNPIGPLQIILTRENGILKISDLASGVLFNPSGDALVLVDAQGQIYTRSLDDGKRTNLGDPGFYPSPAQLSNTAAPRISPDGNFLFVEPPGNAPAPAYLIQMDGKKMWGLGSRPALFDWSPDSTRYAYVTGGSPNQLFFGRVGGFAPATVWWPGPIQAIAWSPLGDWIGVAFEDNRQAAEKLSIARLSTASNGAFDTVWSTPWPAGTIIPANALAWTADQNELWFLPARVSIHFEDRTAYALIRRPDDQATDDLVATLLGNPTSTSGPAVLSPDKKWFAQVVDNPSPTALFMGHFWVGVRPAASAIPGFSFFPGVEQLAWVGDSHSLIAARSLTGPPSPPTGLVFDRLNPVTQETAPLFEETPAQVFLGLQSALRAASRPAPLTAEVERVSQTEADPNWVGYHSPALIISIEFPDRWSIWETSVQSTLTPTGDPSEVRTLTLANFKFTSPAGFASLRRGDVLLQITRSPYAIGQSPGDWLNLQANQTFLESAFSIAGKQAYWAMRKADNQFLKKLVFTTETAGYTVEWYSFTPATEAVVDKILASIQLQTPFGK